MCPLQNKGKEISISWMWALPLTHCSVLASIKPGYQLPIIRSCVSWVTPTYSLWGPRLGMPFLFVALGTCLFLLVLFSIHFLIPLWFDSSLLPAAHQHDPTLALSLFNIVPSFFLALIHPRGAWHFSQDVYPLCTTRHHLLWTLHRYWTVILVILDLSPTGDPWGSLSSELEDLVTKFK